VVGSAAANGDGLRRQRTSRARPERHRARPLLAARRHTHELGAQDIDHALGLDDVKDMTRLMHETTPSGRKLTHAECPTIQQNLARLGG
jgi:hypothetical protein